MRLRGRGIRRLNGGGARGDQYVTLKIDMPSALTDRQIELIEEFDRIERGEDVWEDEGEDATADADEDADAADEAASAETTSGESSESEERGFFSKMMGR